MSDDNAKSQIKASGEDKPETAEAPEPIDVKLLEMLVCPLTKQNLIYDAEAQELISKSARRAYPVRGGVPIMLPSEAREITDDLPS